MRMRAPIGSAVAVAVVALAGACGAAQVRPGEPGESGTACPREAAPVGGAGCRCAPGLYVVDGACAGARDVDEYCGVETAGAPREPGGACVAPRCPADGALDPTREICLGARDARAALSSERPVPDEATLGCRDGRVLVAHGEHVTCLELADACPRGSEWSAARDACTPFAPCPPGALRSGPACLPLTRRGPRSDAPLLVDLAAWAPARLGNDGGEGSAYLCRPFQRQPWDFDVGPGGLRRIALEVTLLFPDNDVTQVKSEVTVADASSGAPLFPGAQRAADRGVASLLAPLRALGGTASVASMTSRVICPLRGGASPLVLGNPRSP